MDWKNLFLSYQGRINRKPYWLGSLAFGIVYFIIIGIILVSSGLFRLDPSEAGAFEVAMQSASIPLNIVTILSIWPTYAILAKRWHDRGKSGWWSLIILVPIVGAVWILVECGFLRGTEGPNQYGNDPLA